MIIDKVPLNELARSWEEIREDYDDLFNDEYDRTVLDCAARLAADPGGELAYVWTIGLLLTAPYLAWAPGDNVVPEARAALRAADSTLRGRPCDHDTHPHQDHDIECEMYLAEQLCELADDNAEWNENHPREEWLCPRNVAGLARIAMDIIEPGSATDVPPRLPVGAQGTVDRLSALLEGYPQPGTEIDEEISSQASDLRLAGLADRPGQLLVVMAVTWYAVSDFVRNTAVLDELISALEETLPLYAEASCAHDRHAYPPGSGPDAVELGIMLTSPGGRALYEQGRRESRDAPLEHLLCPVALAEIAEGSLSTLRARRDQLLQDRDTCRENTE